MFNYPAGQFIPGFGPPRNYFAPNADGALGGNPAFTRFLDNTQLFHPDDNQKGWKDTIKMLPGQVTRIVARWAPQDVLIGRVQPGDNAFAFVSIQPEAQAIFKSVEQSSLAPCRGPPRPVTG